jgi:hypothetical protein
MKIKVVIIVNTLYRNITLLLDFVLAWGGRFKCTLQTHRPSFKITPISQVSGIIMYGRLVDLIKMNNFAPSHTGTRPYPRAINRCLF